MSTKLILATTLICLFVETGSFTAVAEDLCSDSRAAETADPEQAERSAAEAEKVAAERALAEQGNARAQFNLGVMYAQGRGVIQDYAEAMRWYREAAKQGDVDAQYSIGLMYATGTGVARDATTAYIWFYIAAANGDKHAIEVRDTAAGDLAPSQIVEAQERAKGCISSGYEDCD